MTQYTVALAGNPNCGKTTLFNVLTKSHQKVGNFAGVTVERHTGTFSLNNAISCSLIDLPGTYSIYAKTEDETITTNILLQTKAEKIDLVIIVVDATNLYRNLLLFSQIYDLQSPILLALNMIDEAQDMALQINMEELKQILRVPIVALSARTHQGIESLKSTIIDCLINKSELIRNCNFYTTKINFETLLLSQDHSISYANIVAHHINAISTVETQKEQAFETISRYKKIAEITQKTVIKSKKIDIKSQKIDALLLHPIFGYLAMLIIFVIMFQAIFSWSEYPMNAIDSAIQYISMAIKSIVGKTMFASFITDGLLAGIGGIVIFVPQIAILFLFITILEESGYMARVMFLLDSFMKKVGLNGKSIIPLFTGAACAIPAIMAARNINNKKERIITIFIAPFISCSARIPVYTIIIATVIPSSLCVFGYFSMQALVMIGLYLLGFAIALMTSFVLSKVIKTQEKSFFILELPNYRVPQIQNIWHTMYNKVVQFVTESGKIILFISMILWVLANFSPADFTNSKTVNSVKENQSQKLEHSYAGILGKAIEPVFAPLGFDWRIDIAIITSFAAREVFVSTISTIYSIENQDDTKFIKQKLQSVKDTEGKPYFNVARGVSILLFYALALQCMSTIAVAKRETGSWKIPILQFSYSLFLAYFLAYLGYISLNM